VFMEQLGLPLIVALGGSLVIALTLVPLVMSWMGDPRHDSLFQRLEHALHRRRSAAPDKESANVPARPGLGGRFVGLLARAQLQRRAIGLYGAMLSTVLRNRLVSLG